MTRQEAQELDHGLYYVKWRTGGASLAAVGSMHDGTRWIAATNWTAAVGKPVQAWDDDHWHDVESVVRVPLRA